MFQNLLAGLCLMKGAQEEEKSWQNLF